MPAPPGRPASYISIHALREEGDYYSHGEPVQRKKFLSTPSARRATASDTPSRWTQRISIHALREEGDDERQNPKRLEK